MHYHHFGTNIVNLLNDTPGLRNDLHTFSWTLQYLLTGSVVLRHISLSNKAISPLCPSCFTTTGDLSHMPNLTPFNKLLFQKYSSLTFNVPEVIALQTPSHIPKQTGHLSSCNKEVSNTCSLDITIVYTVIMNTSDTLTKHSALQKHPFLLK